MNKFYISLLAGVVGVTVLDILAYRSTVKRIDTNRDRVINALNRIDTLEFEYKELKKERIDNWVDTASDILEGQQDSIDRLERKAAELNIHSKAHRYDIDKLENAYKSRLAFEQDIEGDIYRLEGEIAEIKEILEKTAGVKFTSEEEG